MLPGTSGGAAGGLNSDGVTHCGLHAVQSERKICIFLHHHGMSNSNAFFSSWLAPHSFHKMARPCRAIVHCL